MMIYNIDAFGNTHGEQHAFDFFDGTQTSEERDENHHDAGADQDVGRTHIEIGTQQLFHVSMINTRPYTHCHHHYSSDLEIGTSPIKFKKKKKTIAMDLNAIFTRPSISR